MIDGPVETEVALATRVFRTGREESEQAYREALTRGYFDLGDDEVGALSERAYLACERAAKELKARTAITDYDAPVEMRAAAPASAVDPDALAATYDDDPPLREIVVVENDLSVPETHSHAPDHKAKTHVYAGKPRQAYGPKLRIKSPISGKAVDRHRAFREFLVANLALSRQEAIALGMSSGYRLTAGAIATIHYHTMQTVEMVEQIHGVRVPRLGPGEEPGSG